MLITLAPLAALLLAQDGAPPPTPVRAVRAREEVVVARQRVTGSVRPALDARITARETGALVGAVPRLGDVVEEGAPLVTVDDRRLRAELARVRADRAEAEATLARARAELAEAARDLEALRAARAGDAVSEREVRVALARRDVAAAGETAAAARIEALDADAALLELRVSDTVVRAPFDGVVVERLAEVGEWVSPGDPVVRVVSTATVEIWLDVPERLLAGVGASDGRFEARVPSSDLRVPLEDARVLPLVDRASRTFRVVGRSAGAGLAPGMSVEAEVPTGERAPWTLVPKDALKYRPTGIVVAVVKGSDEGAATVTGPAVDLPVEIAFELAGEVALRPGAVQPGDVVVVEGNERLFPGAPVLATIEPGAPAEGNGR